VLVGGSAGIIGVLTGALGLVAGVVRRFLVIGRHVL